MHKICIQWFIWFQNRIIIIFYLSHKLPTNNPCRTRDSNPQPLDYKTNSLTIRPRLPLFSIQKRRMELVCLLVFFYYKLPIKISMYICITNINIINNIYASTNNLRVTQERIGVLEEGFRHAAIILTDFIWVFLWCITCILWGRLLSQHHREYFTFNNTEENHASRLCLPPNSNS